MQRDLSIAFSYIFRLASRRAITLMRISDSHPGGSEEMALSPELVMQLVQISSAFLVTLNSYIASTREIDRRARRLRRSRMLLLMRLIQLREKKLQKSMMPSPQRGPKSTFPFPSGSRLVCRCYFLLLIFVFILLFFLPTSVVDTGKKMCHASLRLSFKRSSMLAREHSATYAIH